MRVTSIVQNTTLTYQEDEQDHQVVVETPSWYVWLDTASTFVFIGIHGTFTARKEQAGSKRGGLYWKAYRKSGGKLRRAYLGKSEELTLALLNQTAAKLSPCEVGPVPMAQTMWGESTQKNSFAPPSYSHYSHRLTAREYEVLRLISCDLTNLEVAKKLAISDRTVNTHLTSIYKKLGVTSREDAKHLYSGINPIVAASVLTRREIEVLHLVTQGLTDRHIGDVLVISLVTVKTHIRSIYNKLGVNSRSAATRYTIEHGL